MKWIIDLNLKAKTTKFIKEKNKRKCLLCWSRQRFLRAYKELIIRERK